MLAAVGMAIAVGHDAAARRDRQLGDHLRRPARRLRGRRGRLDPRADDRDAADGRPLQRRRRRRGRADRLVGVPARLGGRLRLPARGVHPDPLRGRDRLGLVLGLEHRLRQAPGPDPDGVGRRCPASRSSTALLLAGILAALRHPRDRSRRDPSQLLFILILVGAALLGVLAVLPIGGADMPVVISLLNAATGLSAAAAGFSLDNVALIVAGTLVGSSGTILTMEMATAMNRSVSNVLFAGFGGAPAGAGGAPGEERPHRSIGAQDAAISLAYADSVVIVPGYGLAVAQAQHAVKELANELEKRGRRGQIRDPSRRRPHARPHERAARRGRRPLREARRDGGHQPGHAADRRRRRDRRQRRHQPGRQGRPRQPDRRDADHRGRRGPAGDRDQALA